METRLTSAGFGGYEPFSGTNGAGADLAATAYRQL